MGGSPRATKPGKPVNWDWEPLSLRAMSPRFDRGLTVVRYSWFQLIRLFGITVSVSNGLNQLLSAMQINLF